MTFEEMKTELFARGTDYLEESGAGVARAERWLNQAYREICNLHPWPFLEVDRNDTAAPFSINDLRKVIFVRLPDGTNLAPTTQAELVYDGADLAQLGTPIEYYITGATNVLTTYPQSSDILHVHYIKRPVVLSGTNVPLFDVEYHNIIVDKAMILAYRDTDNFEAVGALRAEVVIEMAQMTEDYLLNTRGPSYIRMDDIQDG